MMCHHWVSASLYVCECVLGTYWKQRAGPHPGFWHAAPADAQSLNVESEGSHSATLACHGSKPPLYLQHRVHMCPVNFTVRHVCTLQVNVTQLPPPFRPVFA